LALALVSCAKPAFTEAVRARFGLAPRDMERIQFFTSRDIVLQREIGDQSKTLSANGLSIREGVRIEEIEIPAHTPGVALRVEGDYMLISFSREHPDRALWFALKRTDDKIVLPDAHDFELVHLENPFVEPGPFKPHWSKGFLVSYAGQKYHVVDGSTWSAHLLYDLDESFAKDKVRQQPPGWRLSDGVPRPSAPAVSASVTFGAEPSPSTPPTSAAPPLDGGAGTDAGK
jgi:hypothetical protein